MRMRLFLLLAWILVPSLVLGEGDITIGSVYTSDDTFRFGQYNSLYEQGAHVNGSVKWRSEVVDRHWQLEARDLGLRNREVSFRLQAANSFDFSVGYSESAARGNDTGLTPYVGSAELRLPLSWQPAVNVPGFDLTQATRDFDQDIQRKQLNIVLGKRFNPGLAVSGTIEFMERVGTRLTGAAIYTNAANPQAVLIPEPVDQDTLRIEMEADLDFKDLALQATTTLVRFSNHEDLVTWQNPYQSGLGSSVDYPAGTGGIATEPDYDQTALSLNASWRLMPRIQFVLGGAVSRTEQDDDLPPYTVNPMLAVNQSRPLTSLDGRLETRHLNLFVLTRPFRRAALNFRYRYRARENTASRFAWNAVIGDGLDQPSSRFALFNRPLEKETDSYTLEASYRLPGGQRLKASYVFEESYRNFAAVEDTELDSWRFTLSSARQGPLQHRVQVRLDDHAGSTYEWSRPFFQMTAVELVSQVPDDQRWSNHPLLRQYHLANFEKVSIDWRTRWLPGKNWQLELTASSQEVEFDKSELGLTDAASHRAGANLSYSGGEKYQAWAWLAWDRSDRDQTGRDFSGGIEKPANRNVLPLPQGSDPTRDYTVGQDTAAISAGIGMSIRLSEKLSLGTEYMGLDTSEENNVRTFSARDLVGGDLPAIEHRLHRVEAKLDWQVRDSLTLSAQHTWYRYKENDYAWSNLGIGDIAKVLTGGQNPPNEVVNMFSIAVRYTPEGKWK
ncbi:MAG: MtrB/PioB family outer membrane beta-barrel protein [Gammaproteobacteria bacterium]|jgi:MtrB/PioB family decaheme-associated outer membrane protein|nr:MtrB/PioB family outer membrane beta-barrel protein [Gammaproteobacteria bacterium]MBT4492243.1 MtrB/PioB family outer membrane beta-barrel protein [Gammaproteobacteria bacterium]MBT7371531.1 MtrB/PioB family outer membrane beta-barrel protein [Gammaproteobacteria bacterium]